MEDGVTSVFPSSAAWSRSQAAAFGQLRWMAEAMPDQASVQELSTKTGVSSVFEHNFGERAPAPFQMTNPHRFPVSGWVRGWYLLENHVLLCA